MATGKNLSRVVIEGAQIRFRNFSGIEGKFNAAGDRNFAVLIDPDQAQDMLDDGWNIKQLQPRDEGDAPQDYLKVTVKYPKEEGRRPPRIVLVTSRGKTTLGEEDINILDWADIRDVDLIVRPYAWDINGKTGISAYLYSIFVTINEDELDLKYADVPETGNSVPDSAQNSPVRFEPLDDDDF